MASETAVATMVLALREVLPEPWRVELDTLLTLTREAWERRERLTEEEYQQLCERWFALGVAAAMHGEKTN